MLTTWDAVSTLDRMFRSPSAFGLGWPRLGASSSAAPPLRSWHGEFDDVMGSALGTATSSRTFEPTIDIRASESEVLFVCDVPGVKDEDLEVTLENHVLTIKGTRRFEARPNEQVVLGRAYGAFQRSFTLPESLDDEKLSANLANGVLTVRIPKHPKAQPRRIPIGNGSSEKQLGG